MILDHVRSGFLLVDRKLGVSGGYTRSCETLLDARQLASRNFTELLRLESGPAAHFQACVDQVFEDIFPEEVSLDQIPRRVRIGERSLSVEGSTVRNKQGGVDSILFTVIDVTQLDTTERENNANRAMVRILQSLGAFKDFIKETRDRLVTARTAVTRGDQALVRRELHTLKGNASAFGLDEVADKIHKIEDEVEIVESHLAAIRTMFVTFLDERRELLKVSLDDDAGESVVIDLDRLSALSDAVHAAGSVDALQRAVDVWVDDAVKVPFDSLFGPVTSYVGSLAEQRGKQVRFEITGGQSRVDPAVAKVVVQNLVHLLRNAIDHGIETPDDRGDKPETATIALKVGPTATGSTRISLSDDGRGIDTSRVLAQAVKMGVVDSGRAATLSQDQIVDLVFADGLSTAQTLTDTSGRGVGMSAVRQAVQEVQGTIAIKTWKGKGTEFVIEIPTHAPSGADRRRAA
jgi:chemotaxis protein histidine kinase CheA